MSYDIIKNKILTIVKDHYEGGTAIMDIRAALRVADLTAEQISLLELKEIVKKMSDDKKP